MALPEVVILGSLLRLGLPTDNAMLSTNKANHGCHFVSDSMPASRYREPLGSAVQVRPQHPSAMSSILEPLCFQRRNRGISPKADF